MQRKKRKQNLLWAIKTSNYILINGFRRDDRVTKLHKTTKVSAQRANFLRFQCDTTSAASSPLVRCRDNFPKRPDSQYKSSQSHTASTFPQCMGGNLISWVLAQGWAGTFYFCRKGVLLYSCFDNDCRSVEWPERLHLGLPCSIWRPTFPILGAIFFEWRVSNMFGACCER